MKPYEIKFFCYPKEEPVGFYLLDCRKKIEYKFSYSQTRICFMAKSSSLAYKDLKLFAYNLVPEKGWIAEEGQYYRAMDGVLAGKYFLDLFKYNIKDLF